MPVEGEGGGEMDSQRQSHAHTYNHTHTYIQHTGSGLEEDLEELQVFQSKWKGTGDRLVSRLLEEQDTVFGCYYAAKWGKQGWAERRGRGDRTERHTTHTREEEEEEEEFRSQLELPTNGARG